MRWRARRGWRVPCGPRAGFGTRERRWAPGLRVVAGTDDGGVTILMVVLAVALFGAVGLVVDGGAKLRAAQQADSIAAEAARAGGQQIRKDVAQSSGRVVTDPAQARRVAQNYLRSAGVDGTIAISGGGTRLVVSTRDSVKPIFLGLLGVGEMTVRGEAEAQLVHGFNR